MDGRSEFFVFMGAAIGTAVALFLVQQVYASYLDVNVVHGKWEDAPRDAKMVAMREAEQQALSGGKLPIKQAIEQLGQRGRGSSNKIAPMQSEDVSAMSGWAFQHGFKAYVPRKAAPAPAEEAVPAEGAAPADGAAPAEGAAPAAQPAAPAPAAAPAAAPAHAGHAH